MVAVVVFFFFFFLESLLFYHQLLVIPQPAFQPTYFTQLNLQICYMFKYSHELSELPCLCLILLIKKKWEHFIVFSISPKCLLFSNPYFCSDLSVMAVVLQHNAHVDFKCIVTLLLNWAK